jgi:hypothetical protein
MNNPLLKDLRDIHLPDPIGLWPLAIGWYFLIALLLVLAILLIVHLIRRSRRLQSRRYMLQRLEELRERYAKDADAAAVAAELSALLRRASLVSFPRREVAGLQGEQWLNFLDETGATREFTQGIGRVLLSAPYQPHAQFEANALLDLATRWVSRNVIKRSTI